MSLLNKTFWKFTAGFVIIILAGVLILCATKHYQKKHNLEYQIQQMLEGEAE